MARENLKFDIQVVVMWKVNHSRVTISGAMPQSTLVAKPQRENWLSFLQVRSPED